MSTYKVEVSRGRVAGGRGVKAITHIPGWAERLQSSDKLTSTGQSYARVPLVFRAINLRCNALIEMPWHLYEVRGRTLKKVDEWPFETALEDLLWRTEAALLLCGVAFWERLLAGERLLWDGHWLNPTTMEVSHRNGVTSFRQRLGGRETATWTAEEIVYFREWSLSDDVGPGVAAAVVALGDAELLHYMRRFAGHFFEGGAMPTVLLGVDSDTPDPDVAKIEGHFKRVMTGVRNAFRVLAIRGSVKPEVLTPPLKDLALPQLRSQAVEDVAWAFGIPKTMLLDAANYATASEHRLSFLAETIRPRLRLYQGVINEQFLRDTNLVLRFAPEEHDAFQADEAARAGSLKNLRDAGLPLRVALEILGYDLSEEAKAELERALAPAAPAAAAESETKADQQAPILGYHIEQGVVTRNEARASVGLPAVDASKDERQRSLKAALEVVSAAVNTGIPLEAALALVGLDVALPDAAKDEAPPAEDEAEESEDADAATEPPAVSEDEQADDQDGEQPDAQAARAADLGRWERKALKRLARRGSAAAPFESDHLADAERAAILAALADAETPERVRAIFAAAKADEDDQRQARMEAEERAARELARALREQRDATIPEGMTPEEAEGALERLAESEQGLRDAIRRNLVRAGLLGGQAGEAMLGVGVDWSLVNEAVLAWVEGYVPELIRGINETTRTAVQRAVAEWISNGEPLKRLIEELEPTFGRARAERIAATEVTRAFAEGNVAAWQASGLADQRPEQVPPAHVGCRCWLTLAERDGWAYVWNTANDDITCAICGPLNGQVVGQAKGQQG